MPRAREGAMLMAGNSFPAISRNPKRTAMHRFGIAAALFWCAGAVQACAYPDQGNMPLRRAVTKVKLLPQTEAWAARMHKAGSAVQYALLLERTLEQAGRCYWT